MVKQLCVLLVILTAVLFCSAFVYADNYYWFEEIKKQVPEDITISYFVQAVEDIFGLYYIYYPIEEEEEEIAYILAVGYRMVDQRAMSRLYIFEKNGASLKMTWSSEEFPGRFNDFISYDFRNVGEIREILIQTWDATKKIRQLWVFSWDRENTTMYYPKNVDNNMLVSEEVFMINTTEYKIIATNYLEDNMISYRYYDIENGDVVLIKEEIEEQKQQNTLLFVKQDDPIIVNYVKEKYQTDEYTIYDLKFEGLYIIQMYPSMYIVKKKEDGSVHEAYNLENTEMLYYENFNKMDDINKDGYVDIALCQFASSHNEQIFMNGVWYYYFLSLRPDGYVIFSPVDENGLSQIWMASNETEYFKDKDGNITIGMYEDEDEWITVYWVWDDAKKTFVRREVD